MPSKPLDRALVPVGQAYGTRQSTVDAMGQAGLPLGPSARKGIPNDMLASAKPTRMPDMGQILAPAAAPVPDAKQKIREIRDMTPNSTLRELLSRTLGEGGGGGAPVAIGEEGATNGKRIRSKDFGKSAPHRLAGNERERPR